MFKVQTCLRRRRYDDVFKTVRIVGRLRIAVAIPHAQPPFPGAERLRSEHVDGGVLAVGPVQAVRRPAVSLVAAGAPVAHLTAQQRTLGQDGQGHPTENQVAWKCAEAFVWQIPHCS